MSKVVVITGANSGIGLAAAKLYESNGYFVVLGCRDEKKGLSEVNNTMRIIKNAMELYGETSNIILGPSPAYPYKIRNYYRWQIIIKGISPQRIVDIVKPKNDWFIDVDPLVIS